MESLPSGQHKTRLLIKVKGYLDSSADHKSKKQKIATGLVLLTLKGLLQENLKPGDHVLLKTKIGPPRTFSTPGSFNYKKHLHNQGILLKGWIDNPLNILKVHPVGSLTLEDKITSMLYLPERIRNKIATFVDDNLDQPARGLYKAILIGDRNDIEPKTLEKFIRSGCIHILAISGMHMGLLALVIVGVLTWLFKRSSWLILKINIFKTAICFAALPLVAYAFIAGFNTPVVRALLMTLIFIIAVTFDRPGNLLNHIIIAAFIILAWKPSVIYTASFQLSFSAVTSIGIVYPLLYSYLFRNPSYISSGPIKTDSAELAGLYSLKSNISIAFFKWFTAGASVAVAAMLGTFPVLLFHFNRISLVAPFTNLMVEPLICIWSLLIGIVACLLIPIGPTPAKALFHLGSFGLTISEKICGFFSVFKFSSVHLPTPTLLEITIYYIFLVSLVMYFYLDSSRRRLCFKVILISFCSFLAIPAISEINRLASDTTSVSVLDVGHGSAVVLQLPHNKNILIDGGGAGSDSFDIGERVIAPFLWKNKISRLDAVIISHPHADHYNGLPFILNHFHPGEIWINGVNHYDQAYNQLLDTAKNMNATVKIPQQDEILFQSGDAWIQCIHSCAGRESLQTAKKYQFNVVPNINDSSLVLRLVTSGGSFLFPGDISNRVTSMLVTEEKNIKADILLTPHHGSKSSMDPGFIEAVNPKYIVISAGRKNPFNLPDKSLYELRKKGVEVLSTGKDGSLLFTASDREIKLSRYQIN